MNFGFVLPTFTQADEILNFAITAENYGVESIWNAYSTSKINIP